MRGAPALRGAQVAAVRAGRRGHAVGPRQVDGADLAADGPDRVEPLALQQRSVGGDLAVEQRAHVRAERRGGDHVRVRQVALGHEQEQQVAEVVALVRADEEDARSPHCQPSL